MATEIEAPQRAKGMVHQQIAEVAKGIAGEHYEQLARNNRFYKAFPSQKIFVRRKWPLYIDMAKQILVGMLGDPKTPEDQKAIIAEVIFKDGAVNPKRMAAPAKPEFFKLTK